MKRLCGFAVLLALAALFAVGPGQALATHVSCGDTITQDTTLDSDLIDCPGFGIVIGADGITLDLNHHVIDGAGVGSGVDNAEAHPGVTVENGAIRDFSFGVNLGPRFSGGPVADRNVIHGLSISGVSSGIVGFGFTDKGDETVVEQNVIQARTLAVALRGSGIVVRGNDAEGGGISVGLRDDRGVTIEQNVIRRGDIDLFADDSIVSKNSVASCLDAGIGVVSSQGVVVEKNSVVGCTAGLIVMGGSAQIEKNEFRENAGFGLLLTGAAGRIEKNDLLQNGRDGINIEATPSVLVLGNFAAENGDDGIDVDDPDSVVTKNVANDNRDLGIEAVSGVIDGGGNKAHRNGNPLQCLNVACK